MTKYEKALAVSSLAFMAGVGACAASPASGEPETEYVVGVYNVSTACNHGNRVYRTGSAVAVVPGGSSCPHD